MKRNVVALLVLCGAVMACGDGACLTLPIPAVHAEIVDSTTLAPAAYRASLIVVGNGFYDSTFVGTTPDSLTVEFIRSSPPGRTGEYDVRVRRAGYSVWQTGGVHVEGSGCKGALSPVVSVRLQPLQ